MADFGYSIVSLRGHAINDGAIYFAYLLVDESNAFSTYAAQTIETPRPQRHPIHGHMQPISEPFAMEIQVKSLTQASIDQLKMWLNPDSGLGWLVADTNNGVDPTERIRMEVSVERLLAIEVNNFKVVLKPTTGLWEGESPHSHTRSITANNQPFLVPNDGTYKSYPNITIRPITAKAATATYTLMQRLSIANRAPLPLNDHSGLGYPLDFGNSAFNAATLQAAGKLQADMDDLAVYLKGQLLHRWLYPASATNPQKVWGHVDYRPVLFATISTAMTAGSPAIDSTQTFDNLLGWPDDGFMLIGTETIQYSNRQDNTVTIVKRGANNSVAASHSADATAYYMQHPFLYLLYKWTAAPAVTPIDLYEPVIDLEDSTNLKHYWRSPYFLGSTKRSRTWLGGYTEDNAGSPYIIMYDEAGYMVFQNANPSLGKPRYNNALIMVPCGVYTTVDPFNVTVVRVGTVPYEGKKVTVISPSDANGSGDIEQGWQETIINYQETEVVHYGSPTISEVFIVSTYDIKRLYYYHTPNGGYDDVVATYIETEVVHYGSPTISEVFEVQTYDIIRMYYTKTSQQVLVPNEEGGFDIVTLLNSLEADDTQVVMTPESQEPTIREEIVVIDNRPLLPNIYAADAEGNEGFLVSGATGGGGIGNSNSVAIIQPIYSLAADGTLYAGLLGGGHIALAQVGVQPFGMKVFNDTIYILEGDGTNKMYSVTDDGVVTTITTPAPPKAVFVWDDGEIWIWAGDTLYSSINNGANWSSTIDPSAGNSEVGTQDITEGAVTWVDESIGAANAHPLKISLTLDRGTTWTTFIIRTPDGTAPSSPAIKAILNHNSNATHGKYDVIFVENSQYIKARGIEQIIPHVTVEIDDTAISVQVDYTVGWPNSGSFTIDNEDFTYSSKTDNTFDGLTRGVNSTTAAVHLPSSIVDGGPFYNQSETVLVYTAPANRLDYLVWDGPIIYPRSKAAQADIGKMFFYIHSNITNIAPMFTERTLIGPSVGLGIVSAVAKETTPRNYAYAVFETNTGVYDLWRISNLGTGGAFLPASPTWVEDTTFNPEAKFVVAAGDASEEPVTHPFTLEDNGFRVRVNVQIPIGNDLNGEQLDRTPAKDPTNAIVKFKDFIIPHDPDKVPLMVFNTEEDCYYLDCTITNQTTLAYIKLRFPIPSAESVSIDCANHRIIDDESGLPIPFALVEASDPDEWLYSSPNGGDNFLYEETGIVSVEIEHETRDIWL